MANGGYGMAIYTLVALSAAAYFAFSAVQGDLGVLQRLEIRAEIDQLEAERDRLQSDVARLRNLTARMSDGYLDLDLLDERARAVLGLMAIDDIAVR